MLRITMLTTAMMLAGGCDKKEASKNFNSTAPATATNGWEGPTQPIPDYGHTADGRKIWAVDDELKPVLINGVPVPAGTYKEVVRIKTGNSGCSATVAGPRVLITAAHCGANGATSTTTIGSKEFSGKVERSSLYPAKDHDIAVVILSEAVDEASIGKFAAVGGVAAAEMKITLLGYGCTQPGGGGGNDGILRYGDATIKRFAGYDMVSTDGAALCFGDSGGPAFVKPGDRNLLLGVNSKGDIRATNYNTRTDTPESVEFLKAIGTKYTVDICGINKDCGGTPPPPPPPPPAGCDDESAKKAALMSVAACLQIPIVLPTNN